VSARLRQSLGALGLDVRGDETSWAAFSPCGKYRYALGRSWELPLFPLPTMLFVLHNPSDADHAEPDPTLTRCIGFAKREACGSVVIVNPMARVATDKRELHTALNPVGALNAAAIRDALANCDRFVVGWGIVHVRLREWVQPTIDEIEACAHPLLCLGTNGDGSPKHPLYLAANTPLVRWP
jgi:hypothetical protein